MIYMSDSNGNLIPVANDNQGNIIINQSNTNLLLNSTFKINQREGTSYTGSDDDYVYTVDRWRINGSSASATQDATTLKWTFTNNFEQVIENYEDFQGLKVTASIKWSQFTGSGTLEIYDGVETSSVNLESSKTFASVTHTVNENATTLILRVVTTSITPIYCKLEIGKNATPNIPRQPSEELWLCQRYYVKVHCEGQTGTMQTALAIKPLFVLPNSLRANPTIIPITYPLVVGEDTNGNFVKFKTTKWVLSKLLNNQVFMMLTTGGNDTVINFKQYNFYCLKNGYLAFDAEIYN